MTFIAGNCCGYLSIAFIVPQKSVSLILSFITGFAISCEKCEIYLFTFSLKKILFIMSVKFEPTGKLVFKFILKFDIETLTYKSKFVAMWCTLF